MIAKMDAWIERTEACVGKLEANPEKSDTVVEHQEVPKEETLVEEAVWGPASSHMVLPAAEEMDPGLWWVMEEVGCCLQRNDPPCHSCTVQGTWSSGHRQGQRCTRNPERMDIQEVTLGKTGMQQWHKELRPKGAATSGMIFRKALLLEILKRRVEPSQKMNVRTLWRCQPPQK
jgi:hypothetical protein